jgi:hypothetical protein
MSGIDETGAPVNVEQQKAWHRRQSDHGERDG